MLDNQKSQQVSIVKKSLSAADFTFVNWETVHLVGTHCSHFGRNCLPCLLDSSNQSAISKSDLLESVQKVK